MDGNVEVDVDDLEIAIYNPRQEQYERHKMQERRTNKASKKPLITSCTYQ